MTWDSAVEALERGFRARQAVQAERARCLEIVERLCEQTAEKQSENACRFPRSGEKFRHGSMVVFELLKELSAAIERDE